MSLLTKILVLIRSAFPLPTWTDKDSVQAWLYGLNAGLADLISTLGKDWAAVSWIVIPTPDGNLEVKRDADGEIRCTLSPAVNAASDVELGDGKKIWALIQKVLPYVLQILPILLADQTQPQPEPPKPDIV